MEPAKTEIIEACKKAIDMVASGAQHCIDLSVSYPELDTYADSLGLDVFHSEKDSVYGEKKKVSDVIDTTVLEKVRATYPADDAAVFVQFFEEIKDMPLAEGFETMAKKEREFNAATDFVNRQMLDVLMFGIEGVDHGKTYQL